MGHLNRTSINMKRAIDDMEGFTTASNGRYRFVYRHGIMTSGQNEGRLVAFFDADTEEELEWKIEALDVKFHAYTDTLADREFDATQNCWYCTYCVLYPFDKETISGKLDGQGAKPLF